MIIFKRYSQVIFLVAALVGFCMQTHAEVQSLDRIIAIVDDDIIMESEARTRLTMVRQQLMQQNTPLPPEHVLTQQVLERLIIESVQLQLASRANITIDNAVLTRAVENVAKQNRLSLDQFRKALAKDGISFNSVRKQIETELLINRVRERFVNGRIKISESELDNFISSESGKLQTSADYRLGLIFLPFPKQPDETFINNQEKLVKEIYQELQKGADFQQIAASSSRGDTALKGGDIGWRKLAQLPEQFADIVSALNVGEISKPIRTNMGIHIFKLLDLKGDQGQMVPQTRVRHILLKTNIIRDEAQAEVEIGKLREQILAGDSFDKLAKNHSDDVGSKQNGGELAWVSPGQLVPEFEKTMNELSINEISQPIKTTYGWHVIQVLERRQKDMTAEIKRNQARAFLRQRKFEEELQNWLREIREEAYVEIKI